MKFLSEEQADMVLVRGELVDHTEHFKAGYRAALIGKRMQSLKGDPNTLEGEAEAAGYMWASEEPLSVVQTVWGITGVLAEAMDKTQDEVFDTLFLEIFVQTERGDNPMVVVDSDKIPDNISEMFPRQGGDAG